MLSMSAKKVKILNPNALLDLFEKKYDVENFKNLEARINALHEKQNKTNQYVQEHTKKIDALNKTKHSINNELIKNKGIFNRFKLLKEYYFNDLKR